MYKSVIFVVLCLLIAINCQTVNSCPPCEDVKGEKQYCVEPVGLFSKYCVAGAKKGGRCSPKVKDDVYKSLPPCKEGLTCNARMGGKCE